MGTGSSSWDGLGMGLHGEYQLTQVATGNDVFTITGVASNASDLLVLEDSDGTELMFVQFDGRVRHNIETSVSAFGIDVRFVGDDTAAWSCAGNFQNIYDQTATGGIQVYALRAHLDVSGGSIVGGREACLALYYKSSTSTATNDSGFIYLDDGASDAQVFLNFGANIGTSGGCIIANAAGDSTHGIRIVIGTSVYYIMVTSCTA